VDSFFVKLWQAVISGLSIGSVYALIAQGYYVTFITTGALNFGQGEFLMMGALFGLTCYITLGLPYGVAVAGAVVLVGLMGVGLERVAIRPVLRHALSLSWVLSTVAISIILKNAAVQIWGPEQIKFPSPFGDAVLRVGPPASSPRSFSSSWPPPAPCSSSRSFSSVRCSARRSPPSPSTATLPPSWASMSSG
jgi:branched-subunit amino acid ABC-type transport system permease component